MEEQRNDKREKREPEEWRASLKEGEGKELKKKEYVMNLSERGKKKNREKKMRRGGREKKA